jgi:hypothetical protein
VSRAEIVEAAALALALSGSVADWPARYVFQVLEAIETEQAAKRDV